MYYFQRQPNKLNKYLVRSILTLLGPLFVLGFYAFICIYYLRNPPIDQVINHQTIDGRFAFYVWFILAVLSLDWASAGLANIEAAAIMNPLLAPRTASQLMWHIDMNWSNILWWLKYLFAATEPIWRRKSPGAQASISNSIPNGLWALLSLTTALLLVGLSLSGLSMELTTVKMPSPINVQVYGPNETSFHNAYQDDLMRQINSNWRSGRQTTPPDRSMFYAPADTFNVSMTYFDAQAAMNAASIQTFLGPAVHEDIIGEVWGIYTNISCRAVKAHDLEMIQVLDVGEHLIYGCREPTSDDFDPRKCRMDWLDPGLNTSSTIWPTWLNESENLLLWQGDASHSQVLALSSLVAAADGTTDVQQWCYEGNVSCAPNMFAVVYETGVYSALYAHDNDTFDSLTEGKRSDEPTTAAFEIYTWQPISYRKPGVESYLSMWTDIDTRPLKAPTGLQINESEGLTIGIGIRCEIETVPGQATLDPMHRTFSSFRHTSAISNGFWQVSPAASLAAGSLAADQIYGGAIRPLKQRVNSFPMVSGIPIGLVSMYNSLGITLSLDDNPLLTPPNLQHAIYKLLGESLIISMKDVNRDPWVATQLYRLVTTRYIVQGIISWKPVLALLAAWALIMSSGALWLIFLADPRWAPALNGFELFKFGAQYAPEVGTFSAQEFRECTDSLRHIPGMVGALPGNQPISLADNAKVFIGLSENEVNKRVHHRRGIDIVFDRRAADRTRS